MPGEEVRITPDWVRQLAELVLMAGCACMAAPSPKPAAKILPSVAADGPARRSQSLRKSGPSPEVSQFMRLPRNMQRQVLDYARGWIDANFERMD